MLKFYFMTLKGQRRSILKLSDREHEEMTDAERAEFISVSRIRLSTEFTKKGDPRSWKDPSSQGQAAMNAMVDHYSAWVRGEWNNTPGVRPPATPDHKGE